MDRLLRTLTAKQFLEWQAFAAIEPFGELRQDYRIASVVTMLANINRDRKKKPTPYSISDFLIPFGDGPEKPTRRRTQTWQQQKDIAKLIAAAFSGEGK